MSSLAKPSDAELAALADKYEALSGLRSARDGLGDAGPVAASSRELLRALARRHPGCLRELDTLGLGELQRRAAATRRAAQGGPREPWMAWIAAFHRLMSAALLVKAEEGRRRRSGLTAQLPPTRTRASALAGFPLPASLLASFAQPPGGRLVPIIMDELARRFEQHPRTFAETLFPSRRHANQALH